MHSFTSCLVHCVWSTKNRAPFLDSNLRSRLWPYLGGIARDNKMKALAVGGVADHVHIPVSVPATLSVANAIQLLKGNSSKWIHETFPKLRSFEWQEGYGAFSIGISGVSATSSYIHGQEPHHRTRTFREEFEAMLRKHNLEFNERMLD
jgi:putative transposase